jgi:hypothetical protein
LILRIAAPSRLKVGRYARPDCYYSPRLRRYHANGSVELERPDLIITGLEVRLKEER